MHSCSSCQLPKANIPHCFIVVPRPKYRHNNTLPEKASSVNKVKIECGGNPAYSTHRLYLQTQNEKNRLPHETFVNPPRYYHVPTNKLVSFSAAIPKPRNLSIYF